MHDAGVSYRRLAMLTGLAPGTLNEFANGKKTPTTRSIETIAAALELPAESFLEWRRRKVVDRLSRDDQLVELLYSRLQR